MLLSDEALIETLVRRGYVVSEQAAATCCDFHASGAQQSFCRPNNREPVTIAGAQETLKKVVEERRVAASELGPRRLTEEQGQRFIDIATGPGLLDEVPGAKSLATDVACAEVTQVEAALESTTQANLMLALEGLIKADRLAVRALVDALPRCVIYVEDDGAVGDCTRPATGFEEDGSEEILLCDKHGAMDHDSEPLRHAATLRALLDRMKGWE